MSVKAKVLNAAKAIAELRKMNLSHSDRTSIRKIQKGLRTQSKPLSQAQGARQARLINSRPAAGKSASRGPEASQARPIRAVK